MQLKLVLINLHAYTQLEDGIRPASIPSRATIGPILRAYWVGSLFLKKFST